MKGKIKEERLYIMLYTYDAFEGVSVPWEWKSFVDEWEKKSIEADEPISVFTDYDEYRDFEVESAHQAKDGSHGTAYYEDEEDFRKWFSDWYDNKWDELLKYLPKGIETITKFPDGEKAGDIVLCKKKPITIRALRMKVPFRVKTMEGWMEGKADDYLMEGVRGEIYPCDKEIFEESYDIIRED